MVRKKKSRKKLLQCMIINAFHNPRTSCETFKSRKIENRFSRIMNWNFIHKRSAFVVELVHTSPVYFHLSNVATNEKRETIKRHNRQRRTYRDADDSLHQRARPRVSINSRREQLVPRNARPESWLVKATCHSWPTGSRSLFLVNSLEESK